MKESLLLLLLGTLINIPVFAEEELAVFNWQLSIGLGISHSRNLIPSLDSQQNGIPQLQLALDFEYKNWFAETPSLRSGQVYGDSILGYRISSSDQHNLAAVIAGYHEGFGSNRAIRNDMPVHRQEGLKNRKSDLMPGLRYQYHATDNQLFSMQFNKDIYAHHGEILKVFYGLRFEQNNWDLYFNNELTWYSAKLINYYYGVEDTETTPSRSAYNTGNGWRWHNGIVGVYPLSTNWVAELGTGINWYTREFTDSPLTRKNPEVLSFVLFRYVF